MNAELHIDERPLTFGKHRGKTANQIADEDPDYIVWMYETIKPAPCSEDLYVGVRQDIDDAYDDLGLSYHDLFGN